MTSAAAVPDPRPAHLYVGTFPRAYHRDPVDTAFGVYALRVDPRTGDLRPAGSVPTPRPGWLAVHPGGRFLYAMNEVRDFEGHPGGGVSAFAADPRTGRLTALGTVPLGEPSPCHGVVDATGRHLIVATFHGGTVHLLPLGDDGRPGPACDVRRHRGSSVHPRRQTSPHAHSVTLDPANRFVLVADLGTDRLEVYGLDADRGRLSALPDGGACLPPGSGPRHTVFHPTAPVVYLVNEMAATVTVFAWEPEHGGLRATQTAPVLPEGTTGYRSASGIAVHPTGRFLYVTTRSHGSSGEPPERGPDSLVTFLIDPGTGRLLPGGRTATGGEIPRSLVLDPDGRHLYVGHQASGNVVTFRVDPGNGVPEPTGQVVATPVPVCLQMVPAQAVQEASAASAVSASRGTG
ncbi:hypothetical protein RVR_8702 [Actinacidiphila reveromycinica]|uniref:Uncharacterized protein n=1 Tax=Actinacidiphila reveromycinica TaxID=659352 RepID=A0A7U3UYV8_9ACTN|nr:lactonase family protein [Streptomyces sp. SN-593]BBB01336.1 hypothetical protein RVR_8702 [Streptomyces sp. SN-593]